MTFVVSHCYGIIGERWHKGLIALVLLVIGVGVPALMASFPLRVLTLILVYAVLAISLGVLMGYAGMESLGQAAFFGIGAYAIGILTVGYGVPWWGAVISALALSTIGAAVIGAVAVRLTGLFFLVMTLAFSQVFWGSAYRWGDFTGGTLGLHGISRPYRALETDIYFYYLVLTVFLVSLLALSRIVSSPFGLTLRGIRDGELRMRTTGYNVWFHKWVVFIICGLFSGVAGVLLALLNQFVSPSVLAVRTSFDAMLMVILGGSGTLLGPVIGSAVIIGLRSYLSAYLDHWIIVLGLVYIATVLYAPSGLLGIMSDLRNLRGSARSRPSIVSAVREGQRGRDNASVQGKHPSRSSSPVRKEKPGATGVGRASTNGEALRLDGVGRDFGMLRALRDVSITVDAGSRIGILGPNGAGKTTLFNVITGLDAPSRGDVYMFGERITTWPTHRRIRLGLGRTFQITNLYAPLTVMDNVRLGVLGVRGEKFDLLRGVSSLRIIDERVEQLLGYTDLWDQRHVEVRHLAYGHQRQLELIVALSSNPKVLLLDEPAAGLSVAETKPMVGLIKSLESDLALLIIEHDMDVAFQVADRIIVLHEGSILAEGTVDEIRENISVREVYLGSLSNGEASRHVGG